MGLKDRKPTPRQASGVGADRRRPGAGPHASLASSKLMEEGWREIAQGLKDQIPTALQQAQRGKPALLRLIARFFRLHIRTVIVTDRPQIQLVLDLPRPHHQDPNPETPQPQKETDKP